MATTKKATKPTQPKPNGQRTYAQALAQNQAKHHSSTPSAWQTWAARLLPTCIIMIGLIWAGLSLISQESEVLFKSQELNLWFDDDAFYQTFAIYPGGWLSWAGSYMMEFFYYPATGVWMLMAAWAAIVAMLYLLYQLKGWRLLWAALIPIMLLACFTQTGYWIFYQKLHGHLWVPTLGIGISVLAALIDKSLQIKAKGLIAALCLAARVVWMAVFAWFGYKYMGAWSFFGLALMGIPACKRGKVDMIVPAIAAVVLIWIVPRLAYQWVYEQTIFNEIYRAGMPTFHYGLADVKIYRCAYYLLALSFLPMMAAGWVPRAFLQKKVGKIAASLLLVGALCGGMHFALDRWNHDKNFHAETAMLNAIDRQDWEGALTTMRACASDTIPPTRAMVMMKNLALFRLGRIGDEMFLYPEGSRQQNIDEYYKYGDDMYNYSVDLESITDPDERELTKRSNQWVIRLTQIAGKKLYYNYGKLNFCYRWCMEDAVEFGWHVEELKLMAKCAMLKGEDTVARKFLNILKRTRYHRKWAEKYEALVGHPNKIKAEPELEPICYLMNYGDRLDGDNTLIEMYLLQTFANGHGADPVYQEMTLICALQMKDIQLFWPRFWEYASRHKDEKGFHMPRYYQEAAYLYGHLENEVDISKLPFDESVKRTYEQFMAFNDQPHIAPLSEAEKAREFKPMFGDSFYYFYFLVRNQKTN